MTRISSYLNRLLVLFDRWVKDDPLRARDMLGVAARNGSARRGAVNAPKPKKK